MTDDRIPPVEDEVPVTPPEEPVAPPPDVDVPDEPEAVPDDLGPRLERLGGEPAPDITPEEFAQVLRQAQIRVIGEDVYCEEIGP